MPAFGRSAFDNAFKERFHIAGRRRTAGEGEVKAGSTASDPDLSFLPAISLADAQLTGQIFQDAFLFEVMKHRDKRPIAGGAGIQLTDNFPDFQNLAEIPVP